MASEVNIRKGNSNLRIAPTKEGGLSFTAVQGDARIEVALEPERLKELQSVIAQAIIGNPRLGEERERNL